MSEFCKLFIVLERDCLLSGLLFGLFLAAHLLRPISLGGLLHLLGFGCLLLRELIDLELRLSVGGGDTGNVRPLRTNPPCSSNADRWGTFDPVPPPTSLSP